MKHYHGNQIRENENIQMHIKIFLINQKRSDYLGRLENKLENIIAVIFFGGVGRSEIRKFWLCLDSEVKCPACRATSIQEAWFDRRASRLYMNIILYRASALKCHLHIKYNCIPAEDFGGQYGMVRTCSRTRNNTMGHHGCTSRSKPIHVSWKSWRSFRPASCRGRKWGFLQSYQICDISHRGSTWLHSIINICVEISTIPGTKWVCE